MFKTLAATLVTLTLAQPVQAQSDQAGTLLLGIITGYMLNELNQDPQTTQPGHHRHRHRNQQSDRRCGWYEQAERHGNRMYYYRYNSCNHRLIGERWERIDRH